MPTLTEEQARAKAGELYDSGTVDPLRLAAALAGILGPNSAASAAALAKQTVAAKKAVEAPVKAVTDAAGVFRDAVELPTRVLRWGTDPGTWERVGYFVVGGALLVIALAIFAYSSIKGTSAEKHIKRAVKESRNG